MSVALQPVVHTKLNEMLICRADPMEDLLKNPVLAVFREYFRRIMLESEWVSISGLA